MEDLLGRLPQSVVSGVLLGGVYALAAVGLSLIWGVMKVVNVAHGVMALLASYVALTLYQHGVDPVLAIALIAPLFFLLGLVVERLFVHPVLQRPEMDSLLVLFGAVVALIVTVAPFSLLLQALLSIASARFLLIG